MQYIDIFFACVFLWPLIESAAPSKLRSCCWSYHMAKMQPAVKGVSSVNVVIGETSYLNCQLVERAFRSKRSRVVVLGSAVRASDLFELVRDKQPDVALISAQLEENTLEGYRVLRDLRCFSPRTRGVMLLNSRDRDLIIDAFRCGARGVVFRDEPVEMLRKCIHAVYHGQVWANSETMRQVIEALGKTMPAHLRDARGIQLLSKREAEVVRLVSEGFSNKDISLQLALSEHTVRNYLFHVFEKLGVSTRVELVLYWLQQQKDDIPSYSELDSRSAAKAG
jgi:DNA-binding NarL/FixJ family response regulator